MDFYDRFGAAVAYVDDGEHIYSWDGRPVAFISDGENVYTFAGNFIGWFDNGWIRDSDGNAMLFTDDAGGGGPSKPMRQFKRFKGFKQFLPFKGFREFVPFKPFFTHQWSDVRFW
jgi:hypothetical protein